MVVRFIGVTVPPLVFSNIGIMCGHAVQLNALRINALWCNALRLGASPYINRGFGQQLGGLLATIDMMPLVSNGSGIVCGRGFGQQLLASSNN